MIILVNLVTIKVISLKKLDIRIKVSTPPLPVTQATVTQATQAPHTCLLTALYKADVASVTGWPLLASYRPYRTAKALPVATAHRDRLTSCWDNQNNEKIPHCYHSQNVTFNHHQNTFTGTSVNWEELWWPMGHIKSMSLLIIIKVLIKCKIVCP